MWPGCCTKQDLALRLRYVIDKHTALGFFRIPVTDDFIRIKSETTLNQSVRRGVLYSQIEIL
jgi:hypothetical protein